MPDFDTSETKMMMIETKKKITKLEDKEREKQEVKNNWGKSMEFFIWLGVDSLSKGERAWKDRTKENGAWEAYGRKEELESELSSSVKSLV